MPSGVCPLPVCTSSSPRSRPRRLRYSPASISPRARRSSRIRFASPGRCRWSGRAEQPPAPVHPASPVPLQGEPPPRRSRAAPGPPLQGAAPIPLGGRAIGRHTERTNGPTLTPMPAATCRHGASRPSSETEGRDSSRLTYLLAAVSSVLKCAIAGRLGGLHRPLVADLALAPLNRAGRPAAHCLKESRQP